MSSSFPKKIMRETMLFLSQREEKYEVVSLPDAPYAASHQNLCELNGLLYCAGGIGAGTVSVNNFASFNPNTKLWTTLAVMPAIARGGAMAGYNNKITYAGGLNQAPATTLTAVRQFTPSTGLWTTPSTTIAPGRCDMASYRGNDGRMYMIGGWNSTSNTSYNYVHSIDIVTPGSLLSHTTVPTVARQSGVLYDQNRYLYVLGGLTTEQSWKVFDFNTASWRTLADIPTKCTFPAIIRWDDRIHVIVTNPNLEYRAAEHYIYDIAKNTWTLQETLTGFMHALSATIVYNDELYFVGGWDGANRVNKVSKFSRFF